MPGYTAEFSHERSVHDPDPNKTCEDCGEQFYAYVIPGRETYRCNDCKANQDER